MKRPVKQKPSKREKPVDVTTLDVGDSFQYMDGDRVITVNIVPTPEPEPSEEFKLLKAYVDADNSCRRLWEAKRADPYGQRSSYVNRALAQRRLIAAKAAVHEYVRSKEPKPKVCGECGRCVECGK